MLVVADRLVCFAMKLSKYGITKGTATNKRLSIPTDWVKICGARADLRGHVFFGKTQFLISANCRFSMHQLAECTEEAWTQISGQGDDVFYAHDNPANVPQSLEGTQYCSGTL